MNDFMQFVVGCVVALALLFVVCWGGYGAVRAFERNQCEGFGVQSGRQTEWRHLSWGSWACLTPTSDGKMIDVHNLREVVD